MIPTKTIINCLREHGMSQDFHLRRIMLEAAKRLEASTEVEHGKWERVTGLVGFFTCEVQCSLCGTPQDQKSKFCPECGHPMDLED